MKGEHQIVGRERGAGKRVPWTTTDVAYGVICVAGMLATYPLLLRSLPICCITATDGTGWKKSSARSLRHPDAGRHG